MGHTRLEELVDLQSSSRIRLEASCRQVKRIRVALTSHGVEKSVAMNALAALEPRGDSISALLNFDSDDLFSEPKDHFELTR